MDVAIFSDSGAPEGSDDYTTMILMHGWGWQASIFKRLLPYAKEYNARIVTLIRRGYPGTRSYTPEETQTLARLVGSPRTSATEAETEALMADHAREIHDFLVDYVKRERIPPSQGSRGGIVVVGWSYAVGSVTALLAHTESIPIRDVSLDKYIRRVVCHDAAHIFYGLPYPSEYYNPLQDQSLSPPERLTRFNRWITGYYTHGDVWTAGPGALEMRTPVSEPPSILDSLAAEDLAELTYSPPMQPTGAEYLFMLACIIHGTYGALKDRAFYPREPAAAADVDGLRAVEVRVVWCDRTFWESPWSAYLISNELEEARKAGKPMRNVQIVRCKGANHFAHWDMPEKAMRAFLGDDAIVD
ncbi:Alpha/Beta hydrolase protein [Trametes punicea]|nr:Alpha/Beta hydrolase protein [Trametes punicea]